MQMRVQKRETHINPSDAWHKGTKGIKGALDSNSAQGENYVLELGVQPKTTITP